MSELARNIASRLRKYFGDRRRAERCQVNLPVIVSLVDNPRIKGPRRPQSVEGHTLDISASGLALLVPVIRIGDHYLAGDNLGLQLKLESPLGLIELQTAPVRYERWDENELEEGYLIGVKIIAMSDADRARYDEYVAGLLTK